jgi:hypothetical protein
MIILILVITAIVNHWFNRRCLRLIGAVYRNYINYVMFKIRYFHSCFSQYFRGFQRYKSTLAHIHSTVDMDGFPGNVPCLL